MLNDNLIGIYLTGSIALGSYIDNKSDFDFTVAMKEPLTNEQATKLKAIHKSIVKKYSYPKSFFDGHFITLSELGKKPNEIEPVIVCSDGKIKNGYRGINAVTWYTLKKYGVTVYGLPSSELPFDIDINELRSYVLDNINSYWVKRLSRTSNIFLPMGLYALADSSVEWCVLGISRMLYTLSENDVCSKENAGEYMLLHASEEYHSLLREAIFIRTGKGQKHYKSSFERRSDMIAYMEYMIRECNSLSAAL